MNESEQAMLRFRQAVEAMGEQARTTLPLMIHAYFVAMLDAGFDRDAAMVFAVQYQRELLVRIGLAR